MPYPSVDLSRIRTYPVVRRENLVALEDLIFPATPPPLYDIPELAEIAERMVAARRAGRPVLWMIGGHVVKCGLAPVLIDLMERGAITHIASNGAATIHDFEIAMLGHTSEDVAKSIEDGSFGMAEETGAYMNRAIRSGARDGLGMGEALGRWLADDFAPRSADKFPYRNYSLLYNAFRLGIPYTVHVAIGTDIIHQHPECDFAATGFATGQDFRVYCATVCDMEGGVFCNFGSAVLGPEVFLKALSIARNLGHPVREIATANFDLVPLEPDYRRPAAKDRPEYYYRPKKNIVIRPTSLGGRGYHIVGDHRVTIPNLARMVRDGMAEESGGAEGQGSRGAAVVGAIPNPQSATRNPVTTGDFPVLARLVAANPELADTAESLATAFRLLSVTFRTGGTLFICGNGGSFADALHIAGELDKSYLLPRAIPEGHRQRLAALPSTPSAATKGVSGGRPAPAAFESESQSAGLVGVLQQGLRTIALGANPALATAIENDSPQRSMGFAQELYALARPGDVLLAISTSGGAQNVLNAVTTAKALGLSVIALTGLRQSRLSSAADIILRAPAVETDAIQAWHIRMYHALCEMLEADAFGESQGKLGELG